MPVLKVQKVGIIACSGEEMPEGLISRQAALKVLNQLRPDDTVTLCLPLFLAGGEGDRSFARLYPTIAIDGCDLRCAYRATEKYSSRPAAGFVVTDLVQNGVEGLRKLNPKGLDVVDRMATRVTEKVDELLAKKKTQNCSQETSSTKPETATCSCGSGMLVTRLVINGKTREIVALPLIFESFKKDHKLISDSTSKELMDTVKIYNAIPEGESDIYQKSIIEAYHGYLAEK